MLPLDKDQFNELNARRKGDRKEIVKALLSIAAEHGASVERRNDPRSPGFSGASIFLRIECKGVGANIGIDDLHGGKFALISWYNSLHPARDFTSTFSRSVGEVPG